MNRREAVFAMLALGAVPLVSFAQQASKVWRIGVLGPLTHEDSKPYLDAFRLGLREEGMVNGRDFLVFERLAGGKNDRLPELATELINLNVDVIVAATTPAVSAAQKVTHTIPIVFVAVADPVRSGFANSVARPGRNITGLTNFARDLNAKRLELLKDTLPKLSIVGLLINPDNVLLERSMHDGLKSAAERIGLRLLAINSRTPEDIVPAFKSMARQRVEAVLVSGDTYHFAQRHEIAQAAIQYRIASIFPFREYVDAGGLLSYGVDIREPFHRAATYVAKILNGAKPGDLPIEQPTKFDLAVNLNTAKALNIKIPESILLRSDQVIE